MDFYQDLLFDGFPRKGGTPRKFTLFNRDHFDYLVSDVNNYSNVYCSISRMPPSGPYSDKVSFDLDAKIADYITDSGVPEPVLFREMRESQYLRQRILKPVAEDMNKLAQTAVAEEIPAVGVYTGLGVHVHFLYQEAQRPTNEMLSTANKFVSELGLETSDSQVIGDIVRILKIPNTKRWSEGDFCGIWTVPMTRDEMMMFGPGDLLEISRNPRVPPVSGLQDDRPEMQVYEDYLRRTGGTVPHIPLAEEGNISDDSEFILEEVLHLPPCIEERALTNNPHHKVRYNLAIHLFNAGFTKSEAHDIIRGLKWSNYDPEMTKKQLKSIWHGNKTDNSCRTLYSEGLCRRLEAPRDCRTYGWKGGNQFW